LKKFSTAFIFTAFFISLFASCATTPSASNTASSKKTEEPVIKNINVRGMWVNLSTDDEEFLRTISNNRKVEDFGLWFKPKGIVQILFKANGTYYTSELETSIMKYKISGAGLSLKFPDNSIIKGIVKIKNNQMTITIPDTPPLILTMTRYEGEEPKIIN